MKKESFLHLSYIKSNRYNDEDANKITCVCSFASVVSNPVQRYGQPTRLLSPWGSPGKNTGVGCHGLLITIWVPTNAYECLALHTYTLFKIILPRDFRGGPVVKNLQGIWVPSPVGELGSHMLWSSCAFAVWLESPCTTKRSRTMQWSAHVLQLRLDVAK